MSETPCIQKRLTLRSTSAQAPLNIKAGGYKSGQIVETDPTVPDWAKKPEPPTPKDIGAWATADLIEASVEEIDSLWPEVKTNQAAATRKRGV